jgi:TRAP-type transport system periplasmic protein
MKRVMMLIAVLACLGAPTTWAQQKIEMKLAYFVGDQHAMSQWLIRWSDDLEKQSGGRLAVKRFPGSQMGPVQQHYDFARTGQADVVWFLHGATPGRFPLTEIVQVPYLIGSAEIGTKVLNDLELRKKYLDAEHRGVKVLLLFTHQPGNVHTTRKPIRSAEDMRGQRIRFASPTIRDFVAALGGTPVGVLPTEQVEQLQKGTIDGVFIDYGGAGIAFKMGGVLKYSMDVRHRSLPAGQRLFAVCRSPVHPHGRGGLAGQHGHRALPGFERRLLRHQGGPGQRVDWSVCAVRRHLRVVHRHGGHVFKGGHPGDAPAWV